VKFLNTHTILWIILPVLLLWVQYQLWLGQGGILENRQLQTKIVHFQTQNTKRQQRNLKLNAEIKDLKQGFASIEKYARRDLGMIKQGEVFYSFVPSKK